MPRQARVVAVGVPHHITHRGNNRQDVFLSDEDRRRYQTSLFRECEACSVRLLGWCWMSNHVHLVAVPERTDSLARCIMRAHSWYAQDFNRRRRRSGHLWHSRFFSCALGRSHLRAALAYVDLNPVRAGLVGEATAYPWSSAGEHVAGPAGVGTPLDWPTLVAWGGCPEWERTLEAGIERAQIEHLRRTTLSGEPFGDDAFVTGIERLAGRSLRLKPPGRPRLQAAAASG